MNRSQAGFTLIEMIVTVGIMVLLSGAALTSYLSFRDRKQASSDARLVMEHLRKVRVKATAVEVPLDSVSGLPMAGIVNYTVVLNSTAITTRVNFTALPSVNNYLPAINFSNGTVLMGSMPYSLVYQARSGILTGGAYVVVVCGMGRYRYTIDVSDNGMVSDPVYAPLSPCV